MTSTVFTNRRTAKNRAFYDSLIREVVCAIYDDVFRGISPEMEHPYYHTKGGGGAARDWDCFKRTNEVLTEKQIDELQKVCALGYDTRKNSSDFDIRDFLLSVFPKITDCDLMPLNDMQCIKKGTTRYE